MRGCVQETSYVKHVFPLTILDGAIFEHCSYHWAELIIFDLYFMAPKSPAKNFLVLFWALLVSNGCILPSLTSINGDLHILHWNSFLSITSGPSFEGYFISSYLFSIRRIAYTWIQIVTHNAWVVIEINFTPIGFLYHFIVSLLA